MRIKKGDNVIVIAGKDKGASGVVARAFPRKDMVVVEGVNVKKRHRKTDRRTKQGGGGQIVEFAAPVHVSNVMVVDPNKKVRTRISKSLRNEKTGKRVRIARKSGALLE